MIRPRVWQVVAGLLVLTDLASAGLARRAVPDIHVTYPQLIQPAIDAAPPGSRIIVGAGEYEEYLQIQTDGISLIGRGAKLIPDVGRDPRNVCSDTAGDGREAGICIASKEVRFAGFVEHAKVSSVGRPVKDVSVEGFVVRGFDGENIAIYGGQNTRISGNTLVDGEVYGVLSVASKNTRVENNTIESTATLKFIAICTDDYSGVRTTNNQISGHYIGLCLQTSHSLQQSNAITGCCTGAFVDAGKEGIKVLDNTIQGTDTRCGDWPFIGGIYLDGPKGTHVEGNTITGKRANNQAFGVAIVDSSTVATNNQVKKNTFSDNDVDIVLLSTGSGNQIKNNECTSSNPPGLCD